MPRVSITIPGKNPQPYRFNLDHKKVTIGRSKDSDIVIEEPSVSGLHATMERVDGGYILRDRGSTNGISLNDEDMDIIDLRNGDDVKVGDALFDYELSEEEQDELDTEEFISHEKKNDGSGSSKQSKDEDEDDYDDDEDDDYDDDEKPVKAQPKKLTRPVSTSAPRSLPQPMMAHNSGGNGGFLMGVGALVFGGLAFFMGINNSYVKQEEEAGRKNVSLLKDMKEGKPAPTEKKSDTEEE